MTTYLYTHVNMCNRTEGSKRLTFGNGFGIWASYNGASLHTWPSLNTSTADKTNKIYGYHEESIKIIGKILLFLYNRNKHYGLLRNLLHKAFCKNSSHYQMR